MPLTENPEHPLKLFCAYARQDEQWCNQLEVYLDTLRRQGLISVWHEGRTSAGKAWANEIDAYINSADIILLLISPDFIASEYCYSIKMEQAIKRHETGEARIIPIILRPTDCNGTPFEKLQALPRNAKPITQWRNREEALLDVAKGIRKVVEELKSSSSVSLSTHVTSGKNKNANPSYKWHTLPNPFLYHDTNASSGIIGRVSGRSKDMMDIIYNDQSAIILSGAPHIGKTSLLRYLQMPSKTQSYSWRQEKNLVNLLDQKTLDATYFVQIDLTPLESVHQGIAQKEVYTRFLQQCGKALQKAYQVDGQMLATDLKGLRELLRYMERNQPETRCFVILDNIDRLDMDTPFFQGDPNSKNPQERGIALLNDCGAIRALTGLIEEFKSFGVILSLQSLPRARVEAQFAHVSADLAHFATTTLQIFTRDDTFAFLSQEPAKFGDEWPQQFKEQAGEIIFSPAEQTWIYEQAGSHPYILQQFCLHTFSFKQLHAKQHNRWQDLEEEAKAALVEHVKGSIITFLNRMWKRLQVALATVDMDTRDTFFKFITSLEEKRLVDAIPTQLWNELGIEIQYILYSEGIVRYDPFQTVYVPGALLRNYLLQKVTEIDTVRAHPPRLIINFPESPRELVILSELEYLLVKMLQEYPKRCPEDALMRAGWNKIIEGKIFTQRMYQLRKKLKGKSDTDIIRNHYGGFYSLTHPDWLQFLE